MNLAHGRFRRMKIGASRANGRKLFGKGNFSNFYRLFDVCVTLGGLRLLGRGAAQ
jgi:hypothetical protein